MNEPEGPNWFPRAPWRSSSARSASRRAADATPRRGPSLQARFGYGAAAHLAVAVRPVIKSSNGAVDLDKVRASLADQRTDLRALEGDGRSLWVVLVIGVGVEGGGHHRVVVGGQGGQASHHQGTLVAEKRLRVRHPPSLPSLTDIAN